MLAMARDGVAEGTWLCAQRQNAGRGRLGRAWHSAEGNFFGSTLVRMQPSDPAPTNLAMLSAVAVHDTVSAVLPDATALRIKWPNDVMLGGAKLSGILLERSTAATGVDVVVIGIGINLVHVPEVPGRATTSLAAQGANISREDCATALAHNLACRLQNWRGPAGQEWLYAAWQDRAHAPGTAVHVTLANGDIISGNYAGIDPDGALRLRLAHGATILVHAGDVALI